MGAPPREPRREVAETMSATSDEPASASEPASEPASATPPPHGAVPVAASPTDPLPEVNRACYEVGPELARGGLGRLVRAVDRRLGRVVALKLLRVRSVNREARFRREARITARLQHPGIVPVHEAGRWPDGEPFYAMKLLEGETLKAVIARRASLDERLALLPSVLSVCEAVAYAHAQGVIHRDIKPSNVMVGEFGETVLVDWGLAKELGEATTSDSSDDAASGDSDAGASSADLTREGKVVGTAAYLPPEQARGEALTETADVYALGALLYHVLTGVAPYSGKDDAAILAQVIAGAPRAAETLEPGIPRELGAIMHKAMARTPAQRYPAARELAVDLRRFLTGQLVGAHQYSRGVLLLRWLRRYRQAVAVSAVSLVVLAVAAVLGVRSILEQRDEARAAERRAVRADAEVRTRRDALLLAQAESWLDRDPTQAVAWLKSYAAGAAPDAAAIERVGREAEARGVARLELHGLGLVAVSPTDPQLAALAGDELVMIALRDGARRSLGPAPALTSALRFSPDGRTLAVAAEDSTVLVTVADNTRRSLAHTGLGLSLAYSDDGKQLAIGGDSDILVVNLASGQPRTLHGHRDGVISVLFSADGHQLLSNSHDRTAWLWDVASATGSPLPDPAEITTLAFGPAGSLAWGSTDGAVRMRDASGAIEVLPGNGRVVTVTFSPDGERVLAASVDGAVKTWSRSTRTLRVLGHPEAATGAWFSRDGARIITASTDRRLRIWDGTGGQRVLTGATARISTVALSADGELISVCSNGDVRVWPMAGPEASIALVETGARGIGELPGGAVMIAAGNGRIAEWDLAGGRTRLTMDAAPDVAQLMALSPDGSTLLSTGISGRMAHVNVADRHIFWVEPSHQGMVSVVAWSPDSTRFASGGVDRVVRVVGPGTETVDLVSHRTMLRALAFSPDGTLLASGGDGADIRLWQLATQDGRALRGHTGVIYALRFSPDGHTLASAGGDATIRLWDVSRDAAPRTLLGHQGVIDALAYTPDGELLVSISQDGDARVWRRDGSSRVLPHGVKLTALALSPDGAEAAIGATDGSIRVWRLGDGALLRVLYRHRADVGNLLFTRDGKWLVSSSDDVTARIWPLGEVPRVDRAWLEQLTSVRIATPQ